MNPRKRSTAITGLAAGLIIGLATPLMASAKDASAKDDPAAQSAMERHFAEGDEKAATTPSSKTAKGKGPSVEDMLEVFTNDVPDDLTVAAKRPQVDLDIKFGFDSADLSQDGIAQLTTAGRALSDPRLASRRFMLSGHTDDRGDATYNRTLSLRRAQSARKFLIDEYGISPERLETAGFGSEHPKMDTKTTEARKVNRRVVLEMIE